MCTDVNGRPAQLRRLRHGVRLQVCLRGTTCGVGFTDCGRVPRPRERPHQLRRLRLRCATGESCEEGACRVVVRLGADQLLGACRDLQTDSANCRCGTCARRASSARALQVACASGEQLGTCREHTDLNHCGMCGVVPRGAGVLHGRVRGVVRHARQLRRRLPRPAERQRPLRRVRHCPRGSLLPRRLRGDLRRRAHQLLRGVPGHADRQQPLLPAAAPCAAGQVCSMGMCRVSCAAGTTNCGGVCRDTRHRQQPLRRLRHDLPRGDRVRPRRVHGELRLGHHQLQRRLPRHRRPTTTTAAPAGWPAPRAGVQRRRLPGVAAASPLDQLRRRVPRPRDGQRQLRPLRRALRRGAGVQRGRLRGVVRSGSTNCDGTCRDTQTDVNNCGACGARAPRGSSAPAACAWCRCGAGTTDCMGVCRDLTTDVNNCGACGAPAPRATAAWRAPAW
jgi:hypothetical protein